MPPKPSEGPGALIKGFTAAAGAGGVGVAYFKALAVEAVIKMHGRTVEVSVASGINQNGDALTLKFQVTFFAGVKRHAVFEARATACFHEDAECRGGVSLLGMQGFDLCRGGFGEVNHESIFIRVRRESSDAGRCSKLAGLLRFAGGAGDETAIGFIGVDFMGTVAEEVGIAALE